MLWSDPGSGFPWPATAAGAPWRRAASPGTRPWNSSGKHQTHQSNPGCSTGSLETVCYGIARGKVLRETLQEVHRAGVSEATKVTSCFTETEMQTRLLKQHLGHFSKFYIYFRHAAYPLKQHNFTWIAHCSCVSALNFIWIMFSTALVSLH